MIKKIKPVGFLIIFAISLLASLMTLFHIPQDEEQMLEDHAYQDRQVMSSDIKIICVDEKTLAKIGPYYDWDRSYFANLINILSSDPDKKPKVIGIDILFAGTNDSAEDDALAKACADAGNVVVASQLYIDSELDDGFWGSNIKYTYVDTEICPYNKLNESAQRGFSNILMDSDGYVRKAYGQIEDSGNIYNSFAYLVAQMGYGEENIKIDDPVFRFLYTADSLEISSVSMLEVLSGMVDPSYFADSIVLVGAYSNGMTDAYSIPIDYSKKMFGVQIQANIISALLNGRQVFLVPLWIQVLIAFCYTFILGIFIYAGYLRNSLFKSFGALIAYLFMAVAIFKISRYQLFLIYIPICIVLLQVAFVLYKYVMLQNHRNEEMQKTLFSMADSMAQAIEGRTPYNASHTKNVAKRSIEMLDYINQMHTENRTQLCFSENDKKQLYLAAMLHDIGKMDVPQRVMDKPTKLGILEKPLKERLTQIKLRLECDALKNIISTEEYRQKCELIDNFLDKLDGINCGRPLKDEEKSLIEQLHEMKYEAADSDSIPYLTDEEYNDLMIASGTLSEAEREIMQSHVVHTDKILSHIYFGEEYKDVRHIAANHHELLNGKGYPKHIDASSIDTLTRILTIMDIFDSLIADDRPYKKPKPIEEAFKILDEEAQANKVDKELLEIAKEIWLKDKNEVMTAKK